MKGMKIMFIVMLLSIAVALMWDNIPFLHTAVHAILDPSAGVLLTYNATLGMLIITTIITLITTILQKYMTDQDLLAQIKKEQKLVQEQMKLARDNPEKTMELSKKSLELTMSAMPVTMRPLVYTVIPFVLCLRWFQDFFIANPTKILGFMSWFWAYLVFSIVLSSILRKIMKVH